MAHDYSHRSTEEDPRMMAFFDSLVQRELDGWSSDDSMSSNEEAFYTSIVQLSQSDIDSDDSIPDIGPVFNDTDTNYSPFTIAFASVMASQAAEGNERFPRLNRALDNIQDGFANISSEESESETHSSPVVDTSDRRTEILSHNSGSGNHKKNLLSELVKKKKKDLQENLKKRMKDLQSKTSVPDISDSESSDTDSSSVSSINTETCEQEEDDCGDESLVIKAPSQNDMPNETQKKLKRLNNLRKRALHDSEDSDLEMSGKALQDSKVIRSLSNEDNDVIEKVQFKKLKRKHIEVNHSKAEDTFKTRVSPDLGPFIKKSGSSIDNRHSSTDDTKCGKRNPNEKSRQGKSRLSKTETVSSDQGRDYTRSDQDHYKKGTSSRSKNHRNHHHSESSTDKYKHKDIHHHHSEIENKGRTSHRTKSCSSHEEDRYRYYHGNHHGDIHGNSRNHTENKHGRDSCSRRLSESSVSVTKKFVKDQKYEDLSDSETEKCRNCDRSSEKVDSYMYEHRGKERTRHSEKLSKIVTKSKSVAEETKKDSNKTSKVQDCVDPDTGPSCSYFKSNNSVDNPSHLDHSHTKSRRDQEDSNSSAEEDQPTWQEFKRFKNKLERARKRYDSDKSRRKSGSDKHGQN